MKKYLLVLLLLITSLNVHAQAEGDDWKLIFEKNWENEEYIVWDYVENEHAATYEATPEGLAIINPQMAEHMWQPMTCVANEFTLVEHDDYIVRLTMKIPSDGTYEVILGCWDGKYMCEVPVTASNDFQVIDVKIPDFTCDVQEVVNNLDYSHVLLGSGWVVGTTIVKMVQVYEKAGTTTLKTVRSAKADDAIYNLAGQKVSTSYKGIVIQNGRKVIVR